MSYYEQFSCIIKVPNKPLTSKCWLKGPHKKREKTKNPTYNTKAVSKSVHVWKGQQIGTIQIRETLNQTVHLNVDTTITKYETQTIHQVHHSLRRKCIKNVLQNHTRKDGKIRDTVMMSVRFALSMCDYDITFLLTPL